ncbi:MAG: HD-GYP domain-containing protein [Acidobacteriota bacterium]|nr:HD-GYP domain-containing protein [Acidobacteriota bacterium]
MRIHFRKPAETHEEAACRRALEESHIQAAQLLGHAVALRDHSTEAHNIRVAWLAGRLGEALGLDRHQMQALMKGAFLHDVGKIGIPDAILQKPGPLTSEERRIMNRHPELGVELIQNIAWFTDAIPVVGGHHERWDGRGYPRGLTGEVIPLPARVFMVVDVFDALVSDRPYKPALPLPEVLADLEARSGGHFDPAVLRTFLPLAPALRDTLGDLDTATAAPLLVALRKRHFGV